MEEVSLGSDAFFPFSDSIERAEKSGVRYIAEPGGAKNDKIVIDAADKHGITITMTSGVKFVFTLRGENNSNVAKKILEIGIVFVIFQQKQMKIEMR